MFHKKLIHKFKKLRKNPISRFFRFINFIMKMSGKFPQKMQWVVFVSITKLVLLCFTQFTLVFSFQRSHCYGKPSIGGDACSKQRVFSEVIVFKAPVNMRKNHMF